MKKILSIILMLMLALTACGIKEPVKTEEELRAEVKAEMEAEAKLKEELKAEIEAEIKEKSIVDVKDKEGVFNFVSSNFDMQTSIDRETLEYYYGDFDQDGVEDVCVYSKECAGFNEVAFVKAMTEGYKLIESEPLYSKYGHHVELENNFILHHYYTGGTGIQMKGISIFKFYDGKITPTNAVLATEERITMLPMEGAENGAMIEISGGFDYISDDKWSEFEHIVTTVETDMTTEASTTEVVKSHYKYKASNNAYEMLSEEKSAGSQQDNGFYTLEELKAGVKVSEKFITSKDSEGTSQDDFLGYSLSLDCNNYVKAKLTYDDSWEFDLYQIEIQEPIFDKPLAVTKHDTIDLTTGGTYPISFNGSNIAKDFLTFVKEDSSRYLEGTVYIKTLDLSENEMDSVYTLVVSDFMPKESELDRMGVVEGNASEDKNIDEGDLRRFDNETLYSIDEEMDVHYEEQHIVVIPMQDSINESHLGKRSIKLTDTGHEMPLKFTVLGEVFQIKLTYVESGMDPSAKTITKVIDEVIKDEVIIIEAALPYDTSYVGVEMLYMYYNGVEGFEFGLDDMRDPESNKIFMKEKGEWSDESY